MFGAGSCCKWPSRSRQALVVAEDALVDGISETSCRSSLTMLLVDDTDDALEFLRAGNELQRLGEFLEEVDLDLVVALLEKDEVGMFPLDDSSRK